MTENDYITIKKNIKIIQGYIDPFDDDIQEALDNVKKMIEKSYNSADNRTLYENYFLGGSMKRANNEERMFLLDHDCDDLCLNARQVEYWKKTKYYIYVSDILEKYKKQILRRAPIRRFYETG